MLVLCRNLCFKLGCKVFEHEGCLKSLQGSKMKIDQNVMGSVYRHVLPLYYAFDHHCTMPCDQVGGV